jgi:hypothetical protein
VLPCEGIGVNSLIATGPKWRLIGKATLLAMPSRGARPSCNA